MYTVEQTRLILPSEYVALANITDVYLDGYFTDLFSNDTSVEYRESITELVDSDFSFGEPVVVTYNTTVRFFEDTPSVPTLEDLDLDLEQAFTGENEVIYRTFVVDSVTDLNTFNIFNTTSETEFRFVETNLTVASETQSTGGKDSDASPGISTEAESASSSTSIPAYGFLVAGAVSGLVAVLIVALGLNARDRDNDESREKQSEDSRSDTVVSSTNWDTVTLAAMRASESHQSSKKNDRTPRVDPSRYYQPARPEENLYHPEYLARMDDSVELSQSSPVPEFKGQSVDDDDDDEKKSDLGVFFESHILSDIPLSTGES